MLKIACPCGSQGGRLSSLESLPSLPGASMSPGYQERGLLRGLAAAGASISSIVNTAAP